MVPGSGLEPLHLSAQASETCVSTNSTTRADEGGETHSPRGFQASPDFRRFNKTKPPAWANPALAGVQPENAAKSARACCISAKITPVCCKS